MKRVQPRSGVVAAFVVAVVVVAAGDPLGFASQDGAATPRARLAECARQTGDWRDACFRRSVARAAAEGRVTETLADLESLVSAGVLDDCHLQAHALAHAVRSALGVERAFLLSSDHCRRGYVHGAAEAAAWGPGVQPAAAHAVLARSCSRFRTPDLRGACSHGFGHALMHMSANDVRRSVRGCRSAAARGIYVAACEAGVMMQNSLLHARLPEGRFSRAAARGCAALASRRLRRSCYDGLGVVAALHFHHDSRRSASLCGRLGDRLARRACLRGVRDEIDESRRAGRG